MNPVKGYRDSLARQGKEVKDHHAENRAALKAMQLRNREKRDAAAAAASGKISLSSKLARKSKKYANVESRLHAPIAANERAAKSDKGGTFLKKKSSLKALRAASEAKKKTTPHKRRTSRLEAVPKSNELNKLAPRTQKNYVASNVQESVQTPRRAARDGGSENEKPLHQNYGQVPLYLQARKAKWAKEEEGRAQMERAMRDCPPGLQLLPESQRLETLSLLETKHEELKRKYHALPLSIETMGQVRRKKEIEDSLKETEESLKIFRREHVYVQE